MMPLPIALMANIFRFSPLSLRNAKLIVREERNGSDRRLRLPRIEHVEPIVDASKRKTG